ncbi:hypothetical protein GGF43_001218, partial [Coemansia sp. RSA 2618]
MDEATEVLAALRGQRLLKRNQGTAGANGSGQPLSVGRGALDSTLDAQNKPDVWTIPASVSPDLTKPAVLGEIISRWATLDDTQKTNVLLGIAHVGQGRMSQAAPEVRQIAQLAKDDVSSDWVCTLGNLIGEVGTLGKMRPLNELGEPTLSEIENAIAQVAAALERTSLCVVPSALGYVSLDAAKTIAPANICDIYGCAPSAKELERIMAQAKKKNADIRSPASSRRPSMAPSMSGRPSTAEPEGSAASSQLNSPEPSSVDATVLSGLFGGESGDNDSDEDEKDSMSVDVDGAPVFVNNYTLPMNVKSSHRADHVGRLSRLLSAASSVTSVGSGAGAAQGAAGDARNTAMRAARGGHAAPGLGARRGALGGGGASKLGMMAPRRRSAAATPLPGAGMGVAPAIRRPENATAITHVTKKIRMTNMEEAAGYMDDRERLLKERRDKAAVDREAKRQKQQEAAEERKRRREEARQQKQAANAAKRPKRRLSKNATGNSSDEGEGASRSSKAPNEAMSPRAPDSDDEFEIPLEYRAYTGDTPDQQALYTSTNALKDIDRKVMYCFFKGLSVPPGTADDFEIVLNESTIDDPRNPGHMCTEIIVFKG